MFIFIFFRISYCTADKTQDKVFAYVSQSRFNETLECHAFLCQKKKIVSVEHFTELYIFASGTLKPLVLSD